MIIIVSLSSVSAYEPASTPACAGEDTSIDELGSHNEFNEIDSYDDFEEDDYLDYDDDEDYEDEDDTDYEDEDDEDYEDEDDYDDEDYEDDEDLDDEDYYDDEDDEDYEEISSFDYYNDRILKYLEKFGTAPEDWYMEEDFNNTYKLYLEDPSSYTLDEENENYETHLKIYDSIFSTLEETDLENNETSYFKFLVMYYLNNYANTTNYTWDENDSFENFLREFDADMFTSMAFAGSSKQALGHFNPIKKISPFNPISYLNIISGANANETDENDDNITSENGEKQKDSWLDYIIKLLKMLFIKFLIFIKTEFNIGF